MEERNPCGRVSHVEAADIDVTTRIILLAAGRRAGRAAEPSRIPGHHTRRGTQMGRKPMVAGLSIDDMARRYLSGETLAEIAVATGLSLSTVHVRLKRAGVQRRPGSRNPGRRRLDLPVAEIVGRYRAGETIGDIAGSLGVSGQAIRSRLIEAGVKRRPPGLPRRPPRETSG
jgi:hypothetical protein